MVFRVKSGTRSLTIKQAIRDEMQGGDFLASMSEKEYKLFMKYFVQYQYFVVRKCFDARRGLALIAADGCSLHADLLDHVGKREAPR